MTHHEVSKERAKELAQKVAKSKEVIREALDTYTPQASAVTWTGGKDSTLNLWLMRQVCVAENLALPHIITIEEGDAFTEITDLLIRLSRTWHIDLEWLCNFDVLKACRSKLGAEVKVADLNQRNQEELARIDFDASAFPFEAESYAGNHLMKTVPLNQFLEQAKITALFMAVRWDEHPARKDDTYLTEKEGGQLSPAHTRIAPILHFTERDVWDTTFLHRLPYCSLYEIGYRSLGVRSTSNPLAAGVPAWEQDLEHTIERGGRRQDKEKAMERLRKLGYM
jgi:phosphoadenosine phosphosulfate reductase